jgi:hypothetical protein
VDRGKGNPVRSLLPREELHPVWRSGTYRISTKQ